MLNPKLLIISAIIGFVLAVVAGIAGGVYFGVIIFRSLLAAAFCSALSFGIAFLARSFLSIPEDMFAPEQQPGGSTVDIVLDDEDLTEDGAVVDMLLPVKPREPVHTAVQGSANAVQKASVSEVSQDEADSIGELQAVDDVTVSGVEDIETLSELPDIDSVAFAAKTSATDEKKPEDDLIPDQTVSAGPSKEVIEMAKAIRTVLVKDDS